jgi:hypothetical protein
MLAFSVRPAVAQLTRSDSAAVLVDAAKRLQAEGERDFAADLLRYVIRWYGGTPVAAEAAALLEATDRARVAGSGRTAFVVSNTLIGAWLGVVLPAAFGADDSPPYGAGLLLGPTAGLAGSLTYTRKRPISSGQVRAYTFSFMWGSWQAAGWREVFSIGDTESCFPDGIGGEICFEETPDTAPWAALLVGGLVGLGTGAVMTGFDIPPGDGALANDAAWWGTWFGLAGGVLAGAENESLAAWALLGGNGLLLSSIPLARAWRPSVGQVRLVSIVGIAGGLAGLGIDLIAEVDDDKTGVAIPLVGSAIGLAIGAAAMVGREQSSSPSGGGEGASALFHFGDGAGFGTPIPVPVSYPALQRDGSIGQRPGGDYFSSSAITPTAVGAQKANIHLMSSALCAAISARRSPILRSHRTSNSASRCSSLASKRWKLSSFSSRRSAR